jgi:predicted glycoside hydrolase/deacetylase ChbG (UPF0249 family)
MSGFATDMRIWPVPAVDDSQETGHAQRGVIVEPGGVHPPCWQEALDGKQRIRGAGVERKRYLVVTADDYGIGPETSRGILDLAAAGRITNTVLLVNSPFAEEAVRAWRVAGSRLELGWHPCLTLDTPILSPDHVPSLVTANGRFPPLGTLMRRLLLRRVKPAEVEAEFTAQYERFIEMVGAAPVNSHHHVQIFKIVGDALRGVLSHSRALPYLRRVRESWRTLRRVPGARSKRMFLNALGRMESKRQANDRLPGNDWLVGVTDPSFVFDEQFLLRWLSHVPGRVVELTCHPGYRDVALIGRDCTDADGQVERRVREMELLARPDFVDACEKAGFELVAPSELNRVWEAERRHAA